MNKTHAAVALIAGLVLNGVVMASWFYDRFVPRTEWGLILTEIQTIKSDIKELLKASRVH